MAALPRWIDNDTLDSAAMLSAYLGWAAGATKDEIKDTVPYLWLIEHRPASEAPVIGGFQMPMRLCATPACARCASGKGGYQFRWADSRWIASYEEMRRPGSYSFH